MHQPTMFNSGSEMGNFIVSSGLLHKVWLKIMDLENENPSDDLKSSLSIIYKVYNHTEIGTVIVFVSSPRNSKYFHEDLVSFDNLKTNFPNFDFISTKLNPSFSVNKDAVHLFASIQNEISSLNQYVDFRPLIITGHSMGGPIASLFTLWLLERTSLMPNKGPLCITFGSPFLGDNGFQQAILEQPSWNLSFLHVAFTQDPIPYLYTSIYKPFGTFLLCSESGYAFLEDLESVLDLMVANRVSSFGNFGSNEWLRVFDYGNVLEKLKVGAIIRGVSELGECDFGPLRTGLLIQIQEISKTKQLELDFPEIKGKLVTSDFPKSCNASINGDIDSMIEAIEKRIIHLSDHKRNVVEPRKKLNDKKIHITYIEWYKKVSFSNGGYYDNFKRTQSKSREHIVKHKNILTQYWNKEVIEAEKKPKREIAFLGTAFLYGGTHYRRIVEPLDIAEWYKKGKKNYLEARSEHYKLLEKWVKGDKIYYSYKKNKASSLTEDSCFWAHVEEAKIKCKFLSDRNQETLVSDLVNFENYVMGLIKNYGVSTEIFLKESSFMRWWDDYEKLRGCNYRSSLVDFMRNHSYKHYT